MKSTIQYGLLLALVVGAVFGLTFFRQNTRSPVEKPVLDGGLGRKYDGPPLYVRQKTAEWDRDDPQYAAELEKGGNGAYDFWVSNAHSEPVIASLFSKSCVCTEVDIGVIPVADIAAWRKRSTDLIAVNLATNLFGAPNLTAVLTCDQLARKPQWSTIFAREKDPTASSVYIPAADPTAGPQLAVVRMKWDGREVKAQVLTAIIQHRLGDQFETTRFEVPVNIVPAVMISSPAVAVGEMNFNDRREQVIYCWSATRDSFTVTVEEKSPHPCIVVGAPRQLESAERLEATKNLRAAGLIGPTRMRCAYAIPVTVYERTGGSQLDLGPFMRRIALRSSTSPDEAILVVQGMVRGNIEIGEDADRDRVNLGGFRADRPHEKDVEVRAKDADVQLRFKSASPDFLNVTLTETSGGSAFRRWKLHVEIDADRASGFLPPNSAIYLETVSNPPRAIRIPVVGNATVR